MDHAATTQHLGSKSAREPQPEFATVAQFAAEEPAFTPASLRWLIFNERENGLADARAIVRIGRKVLIHRERFRAWLLADSA